MRITYNDKLNKLLNPYLESLLKEKSSLEPETLTLFDMFMEDLDMGGRMVYSVRYWNLVWRRSSGKKTSKALPI